jgi:hypothetical protein
MQALLTVSLISLFPYAGFVEQTNTKTGQISGELLRVRANCQCFLALILSANTVVILSVVAKMGVLMVGGSCKCMTFQKRGIF